MSQAKIHHLTLHLDKGPNIEVYEIWFVSIDTLDTYEKTRTTYSRHWSKTMSSGRVYNLANRVADSLGVRKLTTIGNCNVALEVISNALPLDVI